MTLELGIRLRGRPGELDAQRVFRDLSKLMDLLGLLEDARLRRERKPESRSTWSVTNLGLSSVEVVIAPLEPRGGASFEVLERVSEIAVEGFGQIEAAPRVPDGWSDQALDRAEDVTRNLGVDAVRAMVLTLLVDGRPRRTVEITHRASVNIRTARKTRYSSLGSVIGRLDSVSVHGRNRAGLWTDRGGLRVEVTFDDDQQIEIASMLGRRVEIWGPLTRAANDQALSVRVRSITPLRNPAEARPLSELRGIAPDLTDGAEVREYLEGLRGTP
ncbi:MAG: hypothetical protein ACT4NY_34420 [Pseudonocardiales bacterium]